jgi:glucose/arabinose dehydrogenase
MRRLAVLTVVAIALTLAPHAQAGPDVTVSRTVATGLTSPWGLDFLPDGSALVTERDTGRILRIDPRKKAGSNVTVLGTVPGSTPDGEGGLLGIAIAPKADSVYVYTTTKTDNRVLRIPLLNNATRLGKATPILTGIPKASIHNGGRIVFDPQGNLVVATGDAAVESLSQDPASLAGKVLRITTDGKPVGSTPTFSLGHRNVQGLAFDSAGGLWASEFGARDADELNYLVRNGKYGWPEVEGTDRTSSFRNPEAEWSPTSLASPSGIAIVGDHAYVASLRGEVVWQVPLTGVGGSDPGAQTPRALKLGDLGRLRTIEPAPDGSLWLITSNTDGRGDAGPRDDRIIRLTVR